jgi:cell division protein FtsL
MATYVTTHEASLALGCSRNHVLQCVEDGRLVGRKRLLRTRTVIEIEAKSLQAYKKAAADNKRIGREMTTKEQGRAPYLSKGYRYIHRPGHLLANQDGYVAEHVLVMEKHLNRALIKGECVHHINRNRADNDINNLILYSSQEEHMASEHAELIRLAWKVKGNYELERKVVAFIKKILKL